MDALERAEKIDPSFASTYAYKAIIYVNTNRPADAVREYQHALALDPELEPARQGLIVARQRLAMQARPAAGH
jgi:tetratricopeptide (TPR) repeat protein